MIGFVIQIIMFIINAISQFFGNYPKAGWDAPQPSYEEQQRAERQRKAAREAKKSIH